ncbi:hypothetical protein ACWGIB_15670 [Streptomyces xiamenensis]
MGRGQGDGWEPEGWRTGPAWRERRSKRWLGPAAGVVAAVATVLVMRPSLITDRFPGAESPAAAEVTPLPAETERPTEAPPRVDPDRPTREEPFAGSPAKQWADGAEGIEPPEAEAVGGLSAEQVAEGLELAREFLIGTNLDPEVLAGAVPEDALTALDPMSVMGDFVADGLAEPSIEQNPVDVFTRINPERAELLGEVVKVRGHMSVEAGEYGADIHADYTFVYPVVAVGGSDEVTRSVVRRTWVFTVPDPARTDATPHTLWPGLWMAERSNDSCGVTDGYLNPEFPSEWKPIPGSGVDPYDRSGSLEEEGGQEEDGRAASCSPLSRI